MSEILSGARYTLGGLIVLTLWSIGAVQFVEWRLERQAAEVVEVQAAEDALALDANNRFLMEHGYPHDASNEDIRRHHIRAQETPL